MNIPLSFSQDPVLRKALGFLQANRLIEALDACHEALALSPGHAELLHILGIIAFRSGDYALAARRIQESIEARPGHAPFYAVLGAAQMAGQRFLRAAHAYRRAMELDPAKAEYAQEWLNALQAAGDLNGYLAGCEEAMARFPSDAAIALGYKNALPYSDRHPAAEAVKLHRQIAGRHLAAPPLARQEQPRKGGKLTIGYFAPYLHMNFMQAFLPHHDASAFKVIVYTNDLRISSCWNGAVRPLGPDPMQNLSLLKADAVDILVDMVGPTPQMRGFYKLLAYRPARMQLSWFATTATAGVPYIDAVLADEIIAPAEDAALYGETLLRLPQCYLPFAPHGYEPEACGAPPCLRRGHVTFGSANKVFKCSDANFELWRALLASLPESRLHWQETAFRDPELRERWLTRFAEAGIARERLRFTGFVAHPEFYRFYDGIDIALDTTPYNGGITTFEAMWMGVPVVSLATEGITGRTGKTMLRHLPDLPQAAETPEDYLSIARGLAEDRERLLRLRQTLRETVKASPFCDGAAFARALEKAYLSLWDQGGAMPAKAG